ncbi:MAG: 3',5'-cyclic-AMP phosphodiesterase [Dolichospermum sp. WA123]|nr:3',5'-cyclic-AMP phosphodiesterase [Dolichospermum sp. WA123]
MKQLSRIQIIQITDTHLFANEEQKLSGIKTAKSLQTVVKNIEKLDTLPDFLILTGDLSEDQTPESYKYLKDLLNRLRISVYWLPGNHDNLYTMQQLLTDDAYICSQKSFLCGDWQFLLLNSTVPGCVHGQISSEQLIWLDKQLRSSEQQTLIALHHPPFKIDSEWLDSYGLRNPEELFAVIDCYPQIKLVIFGHIHQEFEFERRGVKYLGTPSTSIQFKPKTSKFSLDNKQPGFRLLNLYSDGTWKTEVNRIVYEDSKA